MKKAPWMVSIFSLFLISSASAASLAAVQKTGVLRAASEGAFAPFNYFKGKDLTGFEIDILTAAAKAVGFKTEWKTFPFDSLLIGLGQDRYDVVAASHGVTEERAKAVDFTLPHYCTGGVILSKKGGPLSAKDLKGKVVGVQVGTSYLAHVQKMGIAKEVKTYPKDPDSFQALMSGRIDAVITDKFLAIEAAKTHAAAGLLVGELLFNENVAMAVSKGNATLKGKLDEGLTKILKDGTYKAISEKYFGTDVRCL